MLARYILDRMYAATLPKKEYLDDANPIVKAAALLIAVALAIYLDEPLGILVLLIYPAIPAIMCGDKSLFIESIRAPLPIALLIAGISAIFVPWNTMGVRYLASLFLRVLVIASSFLAFISSTDPLHIAFLLEKARLPKWIILSTVLMWRIIPLTLSIASESYIVTRLKGDKIWRSLVAATAVSILRARSTMEALFIYGASKGGFTLAPLMGGWRIRSTLAYIVPIIASLLTLLLLRG